jgi:hypothetical protein
VTAPGTERPWQEEAAEWLDGASPHTYGVKEKTQRILRAALAERESLQAKLAAAEELLSTAAETPSALRQISDALTRAEAAEEQLAHLGGPCDDREKLAAANQRIRDLKLALGDNAGWFDRAMAAEARVTKLTADNAALRAENERLRAVHAPDCYMATGTGATCDCGIGQGKASDT